jgi:hypothetical protein
VYLRSSHTAGTEPGPLFRRTPDLTLQTLSALRASARAAFGHGRCEAVSSMFHVPCSMFDVQHPWARA